MKTNITNKDLETMLDDLISAKAVWINDREKAISALSSGQRWGTGIKEDSEFWGEVEAIVEGYGFACEVDDSDGNPYLSIFAAK